MSPIDNMETLRRKIELVESLLEVPPPPRRPPPVQPVSRGGSWAGGGMLKAHGKAAPGA